MKTKENKIVEEKLTPMEDKTIHRRRKNTKLMFLIVLFLGVLLITSTYAWFSSSLNVKINFINMKVDTDTGLFISLDGVNWGDEVTVSSDSILYEIRENYPNHTNQWALNGLWTVSTRGIPNPNADKFDVYYGAFGKYKEGELKGQKYLRTFLIDESRPYSMNKFIAFDIFLKNASGSPRPDNIFLTENTVFTFREDVTDEIRYEMSGIMNSIRLGIVRVGSTNINSMPYDLQNVKCDGNCTSYIYEPFSRDHSEKSITDAKEYGITIEEGEYYPTYAVYKEGEYLNHKSGFLNDGVGVDENYFTLQTTFFEDAFEEPLFQIPNGYLKLRVYIWLEGQDIDSLETFSKGAPINLNMEFIKDLEGYMYYND